MSLGDDDAKFPGQTGTGIPPSPTRENPAAVYPKSSPFPASSQDIPGTEGAPSHPQLVLSNPFAFDASLQKLDRALDEVIKHIADEVSSGVSEEENFLIEKFRSWRNELDAIRGRQNRNASTDVSVGNTQDGGLFID
ncbi:hypothetical protein K439DRAFT_1416782 [Ramaria rubella]|nr:hypothetical protein K439DRAFT_1416782 [Ramaria rubella]